MTAWFEYFIKLRWLKAEEVTWRDWISSRTNKTITIVTAIYMSVVSGTISLTDLGVPLEWNNFFLSVFGLITAVGLIRLRGVTDKPLRGHSESDCMNERY